MKRLVLVLAVGVAAYFGLRAAGVLGSETPERTSDVADELVTQAVSMHDSGDHARSAELYREASEKAAAEGDDVGALKWRAQSGVCLKKAGDIGPALTIMEASLTEARERGLRGVEGLALGNLARLHDLHGHFEKGLAFRDELVEFSLEDGDTRLAVWTLEQAAGAALSLDDLPGVMERIDRALVLDEQLSEEEARTQALLRLRAWTLVQLGDDVGALETWDTVETSGASLANQARHLALLGRHAEAADAARAAAERYEVDGDKAGNARDLAMQLWLGELIKAQKIEDADVALFQLLADDDELAEEEGREFAQAPFRVMLSRVAISQGRVDDALADLDRARAAVERASVAPDDASALAALDDQTFEIDVLRAVSLTLLERFEEALAAVEDLAPSQAQGALRAWVWERMPERTWTSSVGFDVLEPTDAGLDGTVRRMRDVLPFDFPSVASLVIDSTFVDLARMRDAVGEGETPEGTDEVLMTGVRLALIWQALEQIDEVAGLDAVPMLANIERLEGWVAGDLPEGSAVASVILGETKATLVLCIAGRTVTTFGISPPMRLQSLVVEGMTTLRSGTVDQAASAAQALAKEILPKIAVEEDLEDVTHITWILPGPLGAFPPAAYVLAPPRPQTPVSWLTYRFVTSMLPHALAGGAAAATVDGARREWLRMGEPEVDTQGAAYVLDGMTSLYGAGALSSARLRVAENEPATLGADATAASLRAALPTALALELSAPSFGVGRLGGVVLAPSDDAPFVDEQRGFIPWHRWPDLALPPVVILDRSRFTSNPGQTPDIAATALMARAQAVLFTRWPSPVEPELMLRRIIEGLRGGLSLGQAVTRAQRDFLLLTRDDRKSHHPRNWAPWLSYEVR